MSEEFDGPANGSNGEDFAEFLRKFLAGESGLNTEELARAAGLPNDPKVLAELANQIQQALAHANANPNAGVNWQLAAQQALLQAETERARLTDLRFAQGMAGQLEVLDAQRSLYAAQQADIQTRAAWLQNRVALFKALGGGAQPVQ